MPVVPKHLYYYVGEKPPALPCEYKDEDGVLVSTPLNGATLTAKCSVDGGAEFDVDCTNDNDGNFTINFATGVDPSSFATEGMLRIDVEVDNSPQLWFLPRFSLPIRTRA